WLDGHLIPPRCTRQARRDGLWSLVGRSQPHVTTMAAELSKRNWTITAAPMDDGTAARRRGGALGAHTQEWRPRTTCRVSLAHRRSFCWARSSMAVPNLLLADATVRHPLAIAGMGAGYDNS
ncbi:unnamed protein product, partial [Urochloa humidicola]